MGRDPEEQKPRSASKLQHPLWLQRQDARDRLVDPLIHVGGGKRTPVIAALPSEQIEHRVLRRLGVVVGVIPNGQPVGYAVRRGLLPPQGPYFPAGCYKRHEPFGVVFCLGRHDHGLFYIRMLAEQRLNLA